MRSAKNKVDRVREGKRIIGCILQAYDGAFYPYSIPDKSGHSIFDTGRRTLDSFSEAVYNYFSDLSLSNKDYIEDVQQKQMATKVFINVKLKLLGNKYDFEGMGQEWLDSNRTLFKEV